MDGGSIAQRPRPELLHPFVRCSTAAPSNVCKTSSNSSDLLFLLALLPVARPSTSRRMAMSAHAIFMHLCGCATPLIGFFVVCWLVFRNTESLVLYSAHLSVRLILSLPRLVLEIG